VFVVISGCSFLLPARIEVNEKQLFPLNATSKALDYQNNRLQEELKLFVAANQGMRDMVLYYTTRRNFSLNTKHRGTGGTPLHFAVRHGHINVMEYLLSAGANTNIQNFYKETPLYIASAMNSQKAVLLLLQYNANPNIATKQGSTALHVAVFKRYYDIANALMLVPGIKLDVRDGPNGMTPLHIAIVNKDKQMVKSLLSHGASPEVMDKQGDTAIMLGSLYYDRSILSMFRNGVSRQPPMIYPKRR